MEAELSKVKAIICSALLMIVMFILLFATIFVRGAHDISLYYVVVSGITGMWISDKTVDFYKWLRKGAE
jgi:hypothetical protein